MCWKIKQNSKSHLCVTILSVVQPKEYQLSLVRKEQLTDDAYSFYFDRGMFTHDFLPGQFGRFILPIDKGVERGNARYFSICSSPLEKDYIMITTRILHSAFKKKLVALPEGDTITFFGPLGNFVLNVEAKRQQVFLAGGIGITPFHSMLAYAAEKHLTLPITFFVSFSTVEEVLFYDELMHIEQEHSTIKIVYTVSHPEESQKLWSKETGRMSPELIKKYVLHVSDADYMIAGPSAMVKAMDEMVQSMGVLKEQIKKEQFIGY